MSYCVNCGVELHATARACPLCHTAVINANHCVETELPPPFPTRREEVLPVNRWELALLLTVLFCSVSVCSGLLNLFILHADRPWSLYVIGAAVMFYIWFVVPLWLGKMPLWLRMVLDTCAIGVYVFLISIDLRGEPWFFGLALPIILSGGAVALGLGLVLGKGRSILSSVTFLIAAVGIVLLAAEYFIDRWSMSAWQPGWSIVVATVCVALIIPLMVIRRRPALRDEVRRRFHM